jgi:hypothetical protein
MEDTRPIVITLVPIHQPTGTILDKFIPTVEMRWPNPPFQRVQWPILVNGTVNPQGMSDKFRGV